jgi:hypothetical protein
VEISQLVTQGSKLDFKPCQVLVSPPVSILSASCPLFVGFKSWKHPSLKTILHLQIFVVTTIIQMRKKTFILLVILAALLIVFVYIFFNRRIQAMETERQGPRSENMKTNPSITPINIKS